MSGVNDKHAYMIIAHNDFYVLKKLVECIDDCRNDIYIHIDRKVRQFDDIKAIILNIARNSNVYFIPRHEVVWGGYSLIECEIALFKEVIHKGNYQYCHLISGVDMPLKSQSEIHNYFEEHRGINYLSYSRNEDYLRNEKKRYQYFRPLQEVRGRNNRSLSSYIEGILLFIQKIFGIDRSKNSSLSYCLGSQWISVQQEILVYIIENEDIIQKNFRKTKCCDEIYKQSLLRNSRFFDSFFIQPTHYEHLDPLYEDCLRAIDVERGKPWTWEASDYKYLINSGMLFARKCSSFKKEQKELVDMLHAHVTEESL